MATETRSTTAERPISLTPSELDRLIDERIRGLGGVGLPHPLPPGAYYGEDGGVYRDVLAPTGRYREVRDEQGKVIRRQSVLRTMRRRVLPVADPSPLGVRRALRQAKLASDGTGPDVYHPADRVWFRNGAKRERDLPENLGDGASRGPLTYVDHDDHDDPGLAPLIEAAGPDPEAAPEPAPKEPIHGKR